VATAKKRCMPRLIPSLGRPLKLFIQAGGRSIKASSVLSAENSDLGCESSANQPRRTASIGPIVRRESCAAAFSFPHGVPLPAKFGRRDFAHAAHFHARTSAALLGFSFLSQVYSPRRVTKRFRVDRARMSFASPSSSAVFADFSDSPTRRRL
jgi:hypothetical protein